RADDYVMAEIRRNRLVGTLVRAQVPFLVPYLAAGALAFLLARGCRAGRRRGHAPSPWTDGAFASAIYLVFLAWSTALGMLETPAAFAGLFYAKGGLARALQIALERHATPGAL